MHKLWSRLSPHPPFPLRNLVFFMILATVSVKYFGYNWLALVAMRSTCCTLEITWFDSQFFFLWWTPLKMLLKIEMKKSIYTYFVWCIPTIRRCEILAVLSRPSHAIYCANIVVTHAAATSPNCSHRMCKNDLHNGQYHAMCFDWTQIPYYVCYLSMVLPQPIFQ